ncbi:MAG: hypothetical protein BWY44_01596 [Candidatus Omnitrophica bacterium ADurb.Bin292]|nr:MAG: hypothetical protein BWY44_01596 [Candidatus Omnitrophica bacterium ADurb.Bin292]
MEFFVTQFTDTAPNHLVFPWQIIELPNGSPYFIKSTFDLRLSLFVGMFSIGSKSAILPYQEEFLFR